jgi:O-antigen ligase
MVELPMFGIEAGVAIFLLSWYLCAKPEYALFFYGLALGFPDFAFHLGSAINIRVDDVLILLFLIRSIIWRPASLVAGQRKILWTQLSLLLFCLFSAAVEFARGVPPPAYETAKMIGCAAIIFALPRLLQSERRLRFLIVGLTCGGIVMAMQIMQRLGASSANLLSNFQEYKSAAAFSTWNPNTLGQAAILAVFAAGIGGNIYSKSRLSRLMWPCLAFGFALIPATMFVRGTTVSLAAGFLMYLFLTRRWKWILAFLVICLMVISLMLATKRDLFEAATRVDFTTGEGLSHRADRWEKAIGAVRGNPLLGQGFGQEWIYLSSIGSEGRAHNAYLTAWIELGVGGLLLFLAVVYQIISSGLSLYRQPQFQSYGALLLALVFVICLDSFGLPTLYWEKLPTISISIGIALIGICERKVVATAPSEAYAEGLPPFPQHPYRTA